MDTARTTRSTGQVDRPLRERTAVEESVDRGTVLPGAMQNGTGTGSPAVDGSGGGGGDGMAGQNRDGGEARGTARTEEALSAEEQVGQQQNGTGLDETVHSREAANINTDVGARSSLMQWVTRQDRAVMAMLRNYVDTVAADLREWANDRFARQDRVDRLERDVDRLWQDVYGQRRTGDVNGTTRSPRSRQIPRMLDDGNATFRHGNATCHMSTRSRDGQTIKQLYCVQ